MGEDIFDIVHGNLPTSLAARESTGERVNFSIKDE